MMFWDDKCCGMVNLYNWYLFSISSSSSNSPVWVTSADRCSLNNICFQGCYSVDNNEVQDMKSICSHTADVYITCGMCVYM